MHASMCRSALVRVACSPDSNAHLLVHEQEQCQYHLVVFSPLACHVEALQTQAAAGAPASAHLEL